MPCHDYPGISNDIETKRRLDSATRVACEALSKLDSCRMNGSSTLSAEARMWWKSHQESDRRREEAKRVAKYRETLRSRARSKLTEEEWKELGL